MKAKFRLKQDNSPSNTYKLLLIGEPDECKSNLLNQLANNNIVSEGLYRILNIKYYILFIR